MIFRGYILSILALTCSLLSDNIYSSLAHSTKRSKSAKKSKKQCSRPKKTKTPKQCKGLPKPSYNIPLPSFDLPKDPEDVGKAIGQCIGAFTASGFNLRDTASFGLWFTDDSSMSLLPAGFYKGADDITDYINFALDSKLFSVNQVVKTPSDLDPALGLPALLPIIANGHHCVLTFASQDAVKSGSIVYPPFTVDRTVGYRMDFTMTGEGSGIIMNHIEIFYHTPYLNWLFGEKLYTDGVATRNCEVLLSRKCPSTAAVNCVNDVESCVAEMLSLPAAESDASISGKSMGCRTLHSSLAEMNEKHCPHMSFIPLYDTNCEIKCQESSDVVFEEVFLPEELSYFSAFTAACFGTEIFVSPSKYL